MSAGALFMGLIVLMGMLGLVNGLWSKNLIINGQVETGDLNADWDCGWTNDDGVQRVIQGSNPCPEGITEPAGDDGRDPHGSFPPFPYSDPFVAKDVAECRITIGGDGEFGDQVANVLIENAYPSYECAIVMALSNTGSIPFNLAGAVLHTPEDTPIEYRCQLQVEDRQVDPGEERVVRCLIHVLQEAEQSDCTGTSVDTPWVIVTHECVEPVTTYEFQIEACVAQWNEQATFEQCKDSVQHEGPGGAGDADGVTNDVDNCPDVANPGQADSDAAYDDDLNTNGTTMGDACDPDDDNPI